MLNPNAANEKLNIFEKVVSAAFDCEFKNFGCEFNRT